MALRDIILKAASQHGININNQDQLNLLICEINDAALELYNSPDSNNLPGAQLEDTVYVGDNPTDPLIAFPNRVGRLLFAIYDYDDIQTADISLETLENRYSDAAWFNKKKIPFRVINESASLQEDIDNITTLTFTARAAFSSEIAIRIAGETDNSTSFEEIVVIEANSTSVETVQNYKEVFSIQKEEYSDYDIDIFDANDKLLSTIPNNSLKPEHLIVKFQDDDLTSVPSGYDSIRFLYKKRYYTMIKLSDEFIANNCDDIIYYIWMQRHFIDNTEKLKFAIDKERILRERLLVAYQQNLNSKIIYTSQTQNAVRAARRGC